MLDCKKMSKKNARYYSRDNLKISAGFLGVLCLLYISASVLVLRTPNPGQNIIQIFVQFEHLQLADKYT